MNRRMDGDERSREGREVGGWVAGWVATYLHEEGGLVGDCLALGKVGFAFLYPLEEVAPVGFDGEEVDVWLEEAFPTPDLPAGGGHEDHAVKGGWVGGWVGVYALVSAQRWMNAAALVYHPPPTHLLLASIHFNPVATSFPSGARR